MSGNKEITEYLKPNTLKTLLPLVLDLSSLTLMWNFEAVLLGHYSANLLAGVGISSQVIVGSFAIFLTFIMGTTIICSRLLGSGDRQQADHIVGQALIATFLLSLFFAVALYIMAPLLFTRIFGLTPEIARHAIAYARLGAFFAPIIIMNVVIIGIIRGSGDTVISMTLSLITNGLNAVLALGFISGRLGLPQLGANGAALASGLAHTCGFTLSMIALISKRTRLNLHKKDLVKIEFKTIKRLYKVGAPNTLEIIIWTLGQLILASFAARISAAALAIHQIMIRLIQLVAMIYQGFAFGNMSMVGHAIGSNNLIALKHIKLMTRSVISFFTLIFSALLLVFAPKIIRIFTPEPFLIEWGVPMIRFLALIQIPRAYDILIASDLRIRGDLGLIVRTTFINLFVFEILLASISTLILGFGLMGLWAIIGLDESLKIMVYIHRLRKGLVKEV
ncbi:MATE family efflux transporter [bacterium]|nr:MATE family efflux transporter [bacterium]